MNKKRFTFIDLFAGCGGLTEGFLQTGEFDGLAHVDWDVSTVNTLRHRLITKWDHKKEDALKRVIHFDTQKSQELVNGKWSESSKKMYENSNHKDIVNKGMNSLISEEVDLVIGGPPCQAYSLAGRAQDKNSMKNDYRNFLFESFVDILNVYRPKIFVFENVTGMLSAKPGDIPVTERIYSAFKESGYDVLHPDKMKSAVLSSYDFQVPQKRKRVIIIGINREWNKSNFLNLDTFYSAIHQHKSYERKNVIDSIGNLEKFYPVNKNCNNKKISHSGNSYIKDPNHYPRFHNQRDIKIFEEWIKTNMNDANTEEKQNFYTHKTGKSSSLVKYRNLEWNNPSNTIVAHLYKDGLLFIHPDPEQSRTITVREAALLQSFPEDFEFIGSMGANYKMIGNAVPPNMAKSIGIAIARVLKSV
tara:strand:- start:255 stop:1502 length:1248 start_codon:yes stop_codon:yes gene_type:complete